MNQSKKVTEGALLTAIFVILMLIGIFVPGAIMIIIFVLPVPFIFYSYKHDWRPSLIMLGVAILLSSLFATIVSVPLAILAGLGGIMIGTAIHRNLSVYETWARGTLGFVIGLLLIFIFTQAILQIDLSNAIDSLLNESLELSVKTMEDLGLTEITEGNIQAVEEQLMLVKHFIPAGIAMLSILFAFVSQWLGYKLMNRLEKKEFLFPSFRTLRLPVTIVWIYFFTLIFTFRELDPNGMIYLVVNNVFMLVGMFIVLQGFSYMFFIVHQKRWPKALPIIVLVLTIILPFIFLYFMRILGIIDIGFGLRDRPLKGKK